MLFPALKLPLDGLPQEVGLAFVPIQDGLNPSQRPRWEPSYSLLEIDLFPAHARNIDAITNYYKSYFIRKIADFCCYRLLTIPELMLSSMYRKRESDMTYRTRAKQDWTVGNTVKVGFLTLTVVAKVATPGNWLPDQYAMTNGKGTYYCFIPHNGLTKCASLAEAMVPA